ncbi:hypothetical protein [Thioalkalivibrio nitratireducens]|uniref:hypothetical protein n=1 Tax=Thioalkalivibrio nitratireducens TaxID=186931 RepID=UPI0003102291|nr:hypothetical protein [Thioalkalivibrio nitratireducens]
MPSFILQFLLPAPDRPQRTPVAIRAEGELPEYAQIWIWDMLYARQLYAMAEGPLAAELRETLEIWAVNMSSKVFQPRDHVRSKGHLQLSDDLEWVVDADAEQVAQSVRVEVEGRGGAGDLPRIRVSPDILPNETRFWLVLALAQYFIDENDLFARELPIHVLAFRKYHADIHRPDTPEAAEEAPFYAIQKALEYFQSAGHAR